MEKIYKELIKRTEKYRKSQEKSNASVILPSVTPNALPEAKEEKPVEKHAPTEKEIIAKILDFFLENKSGTFYVIHAYVGDLCPEKDLPKYLDQLISYGVIGKNDMIYETVDDEALKVFADEWKQE